MPDYLKTANLIETASRALADAARKSGDVDDAPIRETVIYMHNMSQNARRMHGMAEATRLAPFRPGHGVKTNIGDPNPKGPSGGGGKSKRK